MLLPWFALLLIWFDKSSRYATPDVGLQEGDEMFPLSMAFGTDLGVLSNITRAKQPERDVHSQMVPSFNPLPNNSLWHGA
jgi:hypothetical protein